MSRAARRSLLLVLLLALAAGGLLLSLLTGPAPTTFRDLMDFLVRGEKTNAAIFGELRLPRALLALLVGASLSLSGAILQGYFGNPMADPFVVGVSSGASLGAVFCLSVGLSAGLVGLSAQSLMSFLAGLGVVTLVYALSRRKGLLRLETLLLIGIAAGALASALTSTLLFLRSDSYEQAVFWLLGSFSAADWNLVAVVFPPFLAGLAASQILSRDMNLLVLGDETAQSLGCPVQGVRKAFLVLATLLAAVSVSVSGTIGFVGLIVPHGIRILIGPDHRFLFPFSALAGGTFLLYSDLLARTVLFPTELPIGVITAAAGAPFFIFLLTRRR